MPEPPPRTGLICRILLLIPPRAQEYVTKIALACRYNVVPKDIIGDYIAELLGSGHL